MNRVKHVEFFGFLIFAFTSLMTSCDPAIGYEYYIDNKSNKELKVQYHGLGFNEKTDTLVISPNTKILLFDTKSWGSKPHDEKDQFLQMLDTLIITATDSSKFKIDYLNRDSWIYSNEIGHLGFIEVGSNIYKLEISNEDFE